MHKEGRYNTYSDWVLSGAACMLSIPRNKKYHDKPCAGKEPYSHKEPWREANVAGLLGSSGGSGWFERWGQSRAFLEITYLVTDERD